MADSGVQAILFKCVVFLLLIVILNEYRISNELRKSILAEIQTFNSRLTELIQSNTFLDQKKNLEEAVLAYGATIAFTERSDSLENGKGGE
ncbi:MAG: hypothetical protein HOG49_22040 [Candidatus Scalindua sp.]|nr:hypothetical protein [Candidatus Scalindua sp.]